MDGEVVSGWKSMLPLRTADFWNSTVSLEAWVALAMDCYVLSPPIPVLEGQGGTESPPHTSQRHHPEHIHPSFHLCLAGLFAPSQLKTFPPALNNPLDSYPWNDPNHSYLFSICPHVSSNHTLNIITQRYCCSITKLCPTLCNPMDCRTLGFSAIHYLPEIAPTPVCWLGDAIQSSHPCHSLLLLPSIFPSIRVFFNGLTLPSGGQSIGASASASVLPMNYLQWIFKVYFL